MEDKFDFEEASRLCDKNIFLVYFDEALTNRNFVLKLRKLLESKCLNSDLFKEKVRNLDEELKLRQIENFNKHFNSCHPDTPSSEEFIFQNK